MPEQAPRAVGKRVGGALYLHADALEEAEASVRDAVDRARALAPGERWNVAKVHGSVVSLLLYEEFDEVAFPALLASARVNLDIGTVARVDYRGRDNPPILHRKEALLRTADPRRPAFSALTAAAEREGLFREPHLIGTKRAWQARLEHAGLETRGPKLVVLAQEQGEIARHKTAIARRELSQPLTLLLANGILAPGTSLFDYGCGQGDDVAALASHGYDAFGWDPHHAADGPRGPAEVVNLGFVLNVIEDQQERVETLQSAWGFTRRALAVSVMPLGKVNLAGQRPYLDGYLTSRGTFQKYFSQQELRDFIQAALGEAPVALGPGIFAVFRDKDLEQEVLLRRQSRAAIVPSAIRPPARERPGVPARPALVERLAGELQELWTAIVERGRVLDAEEVPPHLRDRFGAARVSMARATQLCKSELFDQEQLALSAARRREDHLVHFAMMLFPGAPRYGSLPRSIQRDVRDLFGSHAGALEQARQLLFSAGKPEVLRAGLETASEAGMGAFRGEGTFRFQSDALHRLPPVVRVVVASAAVLLGGEAGADFVDIKLDGPRVNFLTCLDPSARLPVVAERTRVDLRRLRASTDRPDGLVLYLKGSFLPADAPGRAEQMAFDAKLREAGIVSNDGKGPRYQELVGRLRKGAPKQSPATVGQPSA